MFEDLLEVMNTSDFLLALALLCQVTYLLTSSVSCVVVDGHKRKDLSASKVQKDEKDTIDSFNTKTCGISDPNFEEHEFINMAREGQFPWMASFQLRVPTNFTYQGNGKIEAVAKSKRDHDAKTMKKEKDLHFCCGSFISDKWIITAAHCFDTDSMGDYVKNNKIKVIAGSHKVSSKSNLNKNLAIKRIFSHKSFNKSIPIGFDIALVELKDRVEFGQKRKTNDDKEQKGSFINAICLPKKDKRYKFNETARIAGWGLSEEKDETSMPSKLLTTDILLGKTEECVKEYSKKLKSDKPSKQKEKYDDVICASFRDTRDACQSDSGGPLMQFAQGKAVIIGIVSYGIGCAEGTPGLYTRTSAYLNWIKEITKYRKESSVAFKLLEAEDKESKEGDKKHEEDARDESVKTSTTRKPETKETTTTKKATKTSTTSKPQSTSTTKKEKSKKFKFFDD